jgi:very-short-patch-repair endonuclease
MNHRASTLRKNMTDAELLLWRYLRKKQRGVKFRRQAQIGRYFVCFSNRLIIEVDGGQHSEQVTADKQRQCWLEKEGYQILRFWNNEVLKETEAVLSIIDKVLSCPPPKPSPTLASLAG